MTHTFDSGHYDDLCRHVRGIAEADGVVLIIMGGTRGSGWAAQLSPPWTRALPELLRDLADQIAGAQGRRDDDRDGVVLRARWDA